MIENWGLDGEFGAIVMFSPSIATSVWNCVERCDVSMLSNADVSPSSGHGSTWAWPRGL